MAEKTITYSPSDQGWSSFWSYIPDWMIGMNNTLYTFKNGSLYEHDSNPLRNTFYGTSYESSITTLLNEEPTTVKMFKTIALDSNLPWEVEIDTDINDGQIPASQFVDKEGHFMAHIRRVNGDLDHKAISTQGIGECSVVAGTTITFGFGIDSSVSVGDTLYYIDGADVLQVIGLIASKTFNSVTVSSVTNAPTAGQVIVYVKNSVVESYGARGSFMQVKITNGTTDELEIFEISSNVFKSYM
jgi:hypothetical protein